MAQSDDIAPISGTKHLNYLKRDMATADDQLSSTDLKLQDEQTAVNDIVCERYPEEMKELNA